MNGYQQYKQQSINTMTQGELLILLYDEILKRLMRAEFALDKGEMAVFEQSVKRCREIVRYLIDTLDTQYPISRELRRMYDFFDYEFARLLSGRNKTIISEIKPLVEDMKEAFQEADKKEHGNPMIGKERFAEHAGKKG